jgi:hypothetical protein
MKVGGTHLKCRYPKTMNSLYTQDYEMNRNKVGGKTEMFNRDKEKTFYKADSIAMRTTKQMDYTGEMVPYKRVKEARPATSYGPFISSTSYGHTFQGWDASGSYVPTLAPKGNLQSVTNMPFRAHSAYRDTYKQIRPGTTASGAGGGNGSMDGSKVGANVANPNGAQAGKNRAQKSQISILSSPGKNVPFYKDTTNRCEFKGTRPSERVQPVRHPDNLGNFDIKVDPKVFSSSYRTNFDNFENTGPCKREDERVAIRKELKQLQ